MPPKSKPPRHPAEIEGLRAHLASRGTSASHSKTLCYYADLYLDWCGSRGLDLAGYDFHLAGLTAVTATTKKTRRVAARAYHAYVGDEQRRLRPSGDRPLRADVVAAYASTYPQVRAWLRKRVRPAPPEVADDILQDAALSLVRWPAADGADAGAIVFRSVRSALIDWYKTQGHEFTADLDRELPRRISGRSHPEQERRLYVREVLALLASLPGVGAQGLLLRACTGEPWEEVAKSLGLRCKPLAEAVLETRIELRELVRRKGWLA